MINQALVRILRPGAWICLRDELFPSVLHYAGHDNVIADSISREQDWIMSRIDPHNRVDVNLQDILKLPSIDDVQHELHTLMQEFPI